MPLALLYVGLAAAYLFWWLHVPIAIHSIGSSHDDALFWTQAMRILDGEWLGQYDELTMAKGPAFSFFLAGNHLLGIPVSLSLAALYLLGVGLAVREFARLTRNRYLPLLAFALMLFHPAVVPMRVIRDDIYAGLSLIVVAGALRVARTQSSRTRALLVTVLYGAALAFLWVTREEGVWVLPGMILLLGASLWTVRRDWSVLLPRAVHTVLLGATAVALVAAVAAANLATYGLFAVTDFKDRPFAEVSKTLNSVEIGDKAFLPVSQEKRRAIYRISPTFRELRSRLEDEGNPWKHGSGCKTYPDTCGDFAGGWWSWALREAVAEAGHYRTAADAAAFYRRVNDEVRSACESGRLACRSNPVPFMPKLVEDQPRLIPGSLQDALSLLTLQEPLPEIGPSSGPPEILSGVRDFLGNPVSALAPSETVIAVRGRYESREDARLELQCTNWETGEELSPVVERARTGPGGEAAGEFSFRVTAAMVCEVSSTASESDAVRLSSLTSVVPASLTFHDGSTLHVEQVTRTPQRGAWAADLRSGLDDAYALVLPILTVIGLLAFVIAGVRRLRRGRGSSLLVPSLALWVMPATRVVILVLVDVSSFPGITVLYMSAAFPLLVLASVFSLQALIDGLREAGGERRDPRLARSTVARW